MSVGALLIIKHLSIYLSSDPQLHDLKLLVLELFHLAMQFSSLWRTDTTVVFKLNKPPLSNKPSVSIKPPSNGLEINKPPGGLNRGFTVYRK